MAFNEVSIKVYLAADMTNPDPIELEVAGTRYAMTAEDAKILLGALAEATSYTDEWARWRVSPGCN